MTHTKGVYLEGKGLFWECRKLYVVEAFGNLGLNIILGYYFGITGVLIATISTILIFNFIGGTKILFANYFKKSQMQFLLSHGQYLVVTVINCIICMLITSHLPGKGVIGLIIKLVACAIFPHIIYILFYFKTKIFKESYIIAKRFLKR